VRARGVSGRVVDGSLVVETVHRGARPLGAYELVDGAGDGPTGYRSSRDPRPGDVLGLHRESAATYAVRPAR
jgi:hypothetical protein